MMDNEQDNLGGDYQYTGDDHYTTSDYRGASATGGDPELDNKTKIKRGLIVVGVVVVAFVVYKIASLYIHRLEKNEASMPAAPIANIDQSQSSAEQFSAASAKLSGGMNDQLNQLTQMHGVVKSHLQKISEQNESLTTEITQLGLATTGINSSLSDVTANIASMNEKIQEMNHRLIDLQKLQTAQQTELNKAKSERAQRAKLTYQIQAIVPGRAWLQGTDGSTLTVNRGDNIPNYGIVDRIDVQQGLVVTNSGRILRYGIEAK